MSVEVPERGLVGDVLRLFRVDFKPSGFPSLWRWLLASAVSLVGSLVADRLLIAIGAHVFPGTKHYVHFQFSDYAKLTVIGVLIACLAWPVTTWISSSPRWLFFRMAIAVSAVLLLPDMYLLYIGQPPKAVAALMTMHIAIALVTYNALVRLAPAERSGARQHR